MFYTEKIVMSGKFLEYYKYSKALCKDFKRIKKEKLKNEPKQLEIDFSLPDIIIGKRDDNISRTRTRIKRLVNSNPDMNKFVTLTFADNLKDIKTANRHFTNFIKKLKYKFSYLKYLAIIEFQKRGAVHYHFLCNLEYLPNAELNKIWGHGFVRINKIKDISNLGAYVCKYLGKDANNEKMFKQKKYFYSRNLEEPQKFYNEEAIKNLYNFYNLNNLKPDYKSIFSNKYTGEVEYRQFSIA